MRGMSRQDARITLVAAGIVLPILLNGCSVRLPGESDGPGRHRDVSHVPDAVPKVEPRSRGGNMSSYVVFGKRYRTLPSSKGFVQRGIASWYGRKFHGRKTSNGETYDMYTMSAAHKRLPIPTYVRVKNLENGRSVVVRVNDRGPFHDNRIIDLSYAAASRIGMLGKGTALVEVSAIDPRAPSRPAPTTRVAKAPPRPRPGPVVRGPVVADPTPVAAAPQVPGPVLPGDAGQTPASKPVAAGAPRIFLQAGAFSDGSNAQRLRQRLEDGLSRPVRVIPVASSAGQVHRVQVGPLASVEIADQVSAKMHNFGVSAPLVVID